MSDVTPLNAGPGELSTDRPDPDDYYEDDHECYECGGEGFIVDECDEDSCCCADPECEHAIITCPVCHGKG